MLSIVPFAGIISGFPLFLLTLFAVFLSGFSTALLQKACFGLASSFPSFSMHAFMTGQGISGISVSLLLLVLKYSFDFERKVVLKSVATLYFTITVVVVCISLISYLYLRRLPIYKKYTHNLTTVSDIVNDNSKPQPIVVRQTMSQVFRQIRMPALYVFLVFFVTLLLLPYIWWVVPVSENQLLRQLWVPIGFVVFDLGDVIGRSLPGLRLFLIRSVGVSGVLTVLRFLFLPVFMLSNLAPGLNALPSPIAYDSLFLLVIFLFAVTNGYYGSLIMMNTPGKVPPEDRENAGSVMTMALVWGVCLGVLAENILLAIHKV